MDPKYFRRLTDTANKGAIDREAAAREARIQKYVNDAVGAAPRVAEDAAKKGENKAYIYEFETGTDVGTITKASVEEQAIVKALTSHFVNKGFNVKLEGPGIDGGPSKCHYWWGISISW